MKSLQPHHLKRYKEIAVLLWKHGRGDIADQFGAEAGLQREPSVDALNGAAKPEELASDLEKMGPTFIKLGQVLSSRPDLLPEPYLRALERLQDEVKPFSYEEAEEIILTELGVRVSKAFSTFEREPIAAASLGQVHRAALRDGRPVVVKVQRPSIQVQVAEDLEVLETIAGFLDKHTEIGKRHRFGQILDEFRRTLIQELDYQRESANMETLAENLRAFDRIRVPLPIHDYTSRRVLTMEYVRGTKVTDLGPLTRLELDGAPLADELFRAYLKQVLVDGFFHADPHPGNVFLTERRRIALLDVGMVGHTTPEMQDNLVKLLLAIAEGNGDVAADIAIRISERSEQFHEAEFRRRVVVAVSENQDVSLRRINVGSTLLEVARFSGAHGLFVPSELTLLAKTLLQLEEIGKTLDPEFNPHEAIRRNTQEIMQQRLLKSIAPGRIFGSLLEMKEFVERLPTRLNKILDAVANSELEVKVKSPDAKIIVDGFQKIANRITTGLIVAALIVGASMLMRVQTSFQLFGYPGLAMIFFLFAAAGGIWLVVRIVMHDRTIRKP